MLAIGRPMTTLSGYAPALPTPFREDGAIDFAAFERFCEVQIAGGATALVVCGTTGEAPTLSPEEQRGIPHHLLDIWEVTETASVAVYQVQARAAIDSLLAAGRTPILVGGSGPMDQYVVNHPDFLFERAPEAGLVNPDNPMILASHVKCAAFELPFAEGEEFGTIGGELLSLEVCKAVLDLYANSDFIQRVATLGQRLRAGINASAQRRGAQLRVMGYDAIPLFRHSPDMAEQARYMERYVGAMARRGVILRRDVNFISAAHTEAQIDFTVEASDAALVELGAAS